jgi:CBS domain-containing protein
MGTVHDILARKGSSLHTVHAGDDVLAAARLMNDHKIGSVIVMLEGSMAGILTERDILTRVVAQSRDPKSTRVAEVMTRKVLTCRPTTRLNEARKVMREQRVRHLPVIEDDRVVGMISIGDLNHAEHDILVETIQSMEMYIAGGSASMV